MSQAGIAPRREVAWSDRLLAAIPLSPLWVGLLLAALLLGLLLAVTAATGELAIFLADDARWWQNRDARMAILVAFFAAFTWTARPVATRGALRHLEELRHCARFEPGIVERATAELRELDVPRARRAGLIGLLLIPTIALSVDRDPALYLRPSYWRPVAIWTWLVGGIASWNGAVLWHQILAQARCFSRLGRSLPQIDLLDPDRLAPFARQGLLSALPIALALSFFAINLVDAGFVWAMAVMTPLSLGLASVSLLLPVRGAHLRIREEKRAELARVNAAIRGERAALRDSPIGAQAEAASLADLLAWRGAVAAVREWPFDAPTRTRFALYVAIPLGSWIGGALVERALAALF